MVLWTRRRWLQTSFATIASSVVLPKAYGRESTDVFAIGVPRAGCDVPESIRADVLLRFGDDPAAMQVQTLDLGGHTRLVRTQGSPSRTGNRSLELALQADRKRILAVVDPDWGDCAHVVSMLEENRVTAIVYLGSGDYCRTPPLFGGQPDPSGTVHIGFARTGNSMQSIGGTTSSLWIVVGSSGLAFRSFNSHGQIVDEARLGTLTPIASA